MKSAIPSARTSNTAEPTIKSIGCRHWRPTVRVTLLAKRLQVARELVPADALLAALMNSAGAENDSDIKDLQDPAGIIGQRLAIVNGTAKLEFLPVGFSGARSP